MFTYQLPRTVVRFTTRLRHADRRVDVHFSPDFSGEWTGVDVDTLSRARYSTDYMHRDVACRFVAAFYGTDALPTMESDDYHYSRRADDSITWWTVEV